MPCGLSSYATAQFSARGHSSCCSKSCLLPPKYFLLAATKYNCAALKQTCYSSEYRSHITQARSITVIARALNCCCRGSATKGGNMLELAFVHLKAGDSIYLNERRLFTLAIILRFFCWRSLPQVQTIRLCVALVGLAHPVPCCK